MQAQPVTPHAVAEQLRPSPAKRLHAGAIPVGVSSSSGRKSAADSRAWNSEAAGASPAVLTKFGCEAHVDEHRPDKSEVAGANPAAATKHAGAHGARHRCQRGTGRFDSVRPLHFARAGGPVDGLLKPTTLVRIQLGAPYPRRWERRRFPKSPIVSSTLTAGAAKLMGISIPG